MKINELKSTSGTYVAVDVGQESTNQIKAFLNNQNLNIDKNLDGQDLHCTLIFSRKHANIIPDPNIVYTAKITKYDKFTCQNGKIALVAVLDCPELIKRHKYLMDTYKCTYDFPKYIPNITLSYDFSGEINDIMIIPFEIHLANEYVDTLVLE